VTTLRRDFYLALGGFDAALRGSGAENFEFELRALRRGRVGLIWSPLVSVVRYGGNASADGGQMAIDVIACLDYVLARHGLDAADARVVEAELQRRLPEAIDGAFLHRNYPALRDYARRATRRLGLRARIKCAVAQLPHPLAEICTSALIRPGEALEGHPRR
jgi:hypothetical protein